MLFLVKLFQRNYLASKSKSFLFFAAAKRRKFDECAGSYVCTGLPLLCATKAVAKLAVDYTECQLARRLVKVAFSLTPSSEKTSELEHTMQVPQLVFVR